MKFTAVQFDPDKPYPESAWCHGPGMFYATTPYRGSIPIGKGDWIVDFEMEPVNDQPVVERIAVSNTLYHAFFEPLMSPAKESAAKTVDDTEESGTSGKSDSVAGKDSKSRK